MFKRKDTNKKTIHAELARLETLNYKKQWAILEKLPVARLEALALAYEEDHRGDIRSFRFCELTGSILHYILYERCARFNNSLSHTSETVARYVAQNNQVEELLRKAAAEGQKISAQLEQSQKTPGAFFTDFDITVNFTPYFTEIDDETGEDEITLEGIDSLLMDTLPEFSYSLGQLTEKGSLMFDENWFDLCGIPFEMLEGYHICYFMHEIWEHTHWSIPDILRIGYFDVELTVTYRHYDRE